MHHDNLSSGSAKVGKTIRLDWALERPHQLLH
jgi:hypothetical protein